MFEFYFMNFTLLKHIPFLKNSLALPGHSTELPHQEIIAQRDWIAILIGAAVVGAFLTVQSIFVFLDANTEQISEMPRVVQPDTEATFFDQEDLKDVESFFDGRVRELERLRATPPSTNDPAVVKSDTATSSAPIVSE